MNKNLIKVNQIQLSEVLGITSRHLRNLEGQGLPAEPGRTGGSRRYVLPAAVQWWVRYQVSSDTNIDPPNDTNIDPLGCGVPMGCPERRP